MTSLDRARAVVASWDEELRRELPENAHLFDAHTHLGHDIDGMIGDYEELTGVLDRYGFAGAFMFCLDEHDREPAFSVPNDRSLAHAERSRGKLIPFVRLDLTARPIEEATRCLDLGARGIKLHPRAQRFDLADERLGPVFGLAAERGVPILIHGGRGLPPIADELARLVERSEGLRLIIAHAGIADMARLAGRFGGVEGVYFDTSVWSAVDLLDLMRQVAPEQIVFATDYPYGRLPSALLLALRSARLAGLDEAQVRGVLGETALGIARGEPTPALSAPRGGSALAQPLTFARIHQYISMATPLLWLGQQDAVGAIGLAVNASLEENGHVAEADAIRDALVAARDLWRAAPELADEPARRDAVSVAKWLVHLADILAVTTRA